MLSKRKPSERSLTLLILLAWVVIGICFYPSVLRAANTNVNITVCPSSPYPAPTINSPGDGTVTENSSVTMSGDATPDITVYAYRNDVQVGYVTAAGDGTYTMSVSLNVGTNELKASTNNSCTAPTFSETITVERQAPEPPPEPSPGEDPGGEQAPEEPIIGPDGSPILEYPGGTGKKRVPGTGAGDPSISRIRPVILEPEQGLTVTEPTVVVRGKASANTRVRILRNNLVLAEILSDDEGNFTAGITLGQGENRLVATTGQGKQTLYSDTVVVTYRPPRPGLLDFLPITPATLAAAGGTIGIGVAISYFVSHPAASERVLYLFKRLVWRRK